MRQRIRASNRINLDALYRKLFERARFSPEQRETFIQNRLDLKEEVSRLFKVSGRNGEDYQLTLEVLKDRVGAEYDHKLHMDLGPDAFESFKHFETERRLRNMTRQLGRGIASATEPLSDQQNERLVSLLALSAISAGQLDLGRVDLERATAAAREFLNTAQVAALLPVLAERIGRAREKVAPMAADRPPK